MMALKTASVLAFERKLNTSDALLYAGNWSDRDNHISWAGLPIREKAVRGNISNRLKNAIASDPAKLDAEVQKPNLQTVDTADLPAECDSLKVQFTLRVLADLALPSACNSTEYQEALQGAIKEYLEQHQCHELALRYACNLASGRFLWRNRIGAESVEVFIALGSDAAIRFDAYRRGMDDFSCDSDDLNKVVEYIRTGLTDTNEHRLLTVTAIVKLGAGQEVFPSQELVQGSEKSKHLYSVSGIAGMHSQKIGNAVRTIDTWHSGVENSGAIAIEPYGSVTSRGVAYRQPKQKDDFYSLLDGWVLKGNVPDLEQQHYVAAVLVRGGVFGG